jgi:hypothetical protein
MTQAEPTPNGEIDYKAEIFKHLPLIEWMDYQELIDFVNERLQTDTIQKTEISTAGQTPHPHATILCDIRCSRLKYHYWPDTTGICPISQVHPTDLAYLTDQR